MAVLLNIGHGTVYVSGNIAGHVTEHVAGHATDAAE